jgi:signal transduction histidine kinase
MPALARKGLVMIYIHENNYEQTRQTIEKAYAYFHSHQQEEQAGYAEILAAMSSMSLMEGHQDISKAKTYISEALTLLNDEMMFETKSAIYATACEVAMAEKQWHKALDYGLRSVHDDSLATFSDKECLMHLAEIYMELGDKQKATEYINKVYGIMNRYATDHYQSGLSQMEVLYETEKKQDAITQLTKEKQYYLYGGILVAILLLLLALLFFLYWRSIRLRKRHALLEAKLEGETTERVRIARDLHDRLGGLLTALRLKIAEDNGKKDAVLLTDDAIREMRNVAHHLLPEALHRDGLRTALRDYCQTMRKVSFSFIGDEQFLNKQYEEHLYCIVYELVNNAVKSAHAEHIKVQLMADENLTTVNVSDDGKGMTLDKHNGNGLRNTKERVELMGGMMDIYTPNSGGTEINITIDNHKNPHLGD